MSKKTVGRPSKLTAQQVLDIRAWYEAVQKLPTAVEMARMQNISKSALYGIARYRWHKRVPINTPAANS